MKSFESYQHLRLVTSEGMIANGDYILDGITIRVREGYLNDFFVKEGVCLPAIETHDGNHVEHWRKGVLHCENQPAVIDVRDNVEEWWLEGRKVLPGGVA